MTKLQKWQAVNQCETPLELRKLIIQFADKNGKIQGRTKKFSAVEMLIGLDWFMEGKMYANVLTREFGIRQQAIYLKTFNQ